jgi:TatD DNase family protein
VKGILTIGTYLSRFSQVLALAERFPALVCSVGVHPHHAEEEAALTSIERLVEWGRLPRVVGIGETGLDYHYDHSPRWRQEQSFRLHLRAAQEAGLPVIVHTREADEDTLRILREENQGQLTGVIHCFSGGPWLAEQALELGFFISVSGIASFKKADALRQTLTRVPLNRLLVETDAPYLAPMPYRGKRNEPAYVRHTAAALAQVKGVSLETLAAASRANFFRLFPKAELCWPKLVPEEKPQGE